LEGAGIQLLDDTTRAQPEGAVSRDLGVPVIRLSAIADEGDAAVGGAILIHVAAPAQTKAKLLNSTAKLSRFELAKVVIAPWGWFEPWLRTPSGRCNR
jgi:hypothetical protein